MNFLMYADGLCPNNGRYGKANSQGSFAVYSLNHRGYSEDIHEDLRTEHPLCHEEKFQIVATNPTNNIAEAKSLSTGIMWCLKTGILSKGNVLHICMDSRLVLEQFSGVSQTKNRYLLDVYKSLYQVLDHYRKDTGYDPEKSIALHWIPGTIMKESIIAH